MSQIAEDLLVGDAIYTSAACEGAGSARLVDFGGEEEGRGWVRHCQRKEEGVGARG